MDMSNEVFRQVLEHEGVVAIVTWAQGDAHVVNTWNSYLRIADGDTILIPAAGMNKTEENIKLNPRVKMTIGSGSVQGSIGMGAGFYLEGDAEFLYEGPGFESTKEAFPFATRALAVKPDKLEQTI